ncbi:hypothetical protein DITRI_Ditri16bG0019300 [Diplodiscus trichospermus]
MAYEQAGHGFDNATQKLKMVTDVASDQKMRIASDMALDEAYDAKEKITEGIKYGRDKAANAYDQATQKFEMASNVASDKANDAKETMAGAMQ